MSTTRAFRVRVAVVGTLAGVVATVGVAFAAWLGTADGTAAARAARMSFTVTASIPGTGTLYPALSATGSIAFRVTNSNPFDIQVTDVALRSGGSITSSDPAGCPAANVTLASVSNLSGPAYVVPAGQGSDIVVPGVLTMALDAPSACQDVTFAVPVTVTATSL